MISMHGDEHSPSELISKAQRKGGAVVNDFSETKLALLLHECWLRILKT